MYVKKTTSRNYNKNRQKYANTSDMTFNPIRAKFYRNSNTLLPISSLFCMLLILLVHGTINDVKTLVKNIRTFEI